MVLRGNWGKEMLTVRQRYSADDFKFEYLLEENKLHLVKNLCYIQCGGHLTKIQNM